MSAIVIINKHEPEGEVATRLLELAADKDYDARTVEAVRGEHDATLSFRVPIEVAQAFDDERGDLWPAKKAAENGEDLPVAGVDGDAYAAGQAAAAKAAQADNAADDKTTTPARAARPGKAKE